MHVSVGAEESTLYWRSSVFVLSVFVYTKQSQLPLLKCSGVAGQASTCCHATVNGNFGIWREGRNSNASVFLLESKLQGFLGFSKFLKAQVKNIFIFLRDRNAANPALSHKKKLHMFDYSCCRCRAACLAGSNSYTSVDFILYSLHPLVPLTSPFLLWRSITLVPPDTESLMNRFSCAPTSLWPEAKCFWGCPDFHLFIVIMNTTEIHWWKFRLMER